MKRSGFKPKPPAEKKPPKQHECPECGEMFVKLRMGQKSCLEPACAVAAGRKLAAKKEAKAKAEERKKDRERKEQQKTRSDWIKEAQQAVNAYRRNYELMLGRGCISCGRSQEEVQVTDGWKPGGAWDAGHFLSVGARPNLRFVHENIMLQCKSCNGGSNHYARKAASVARGYEENLRALKGDEYVDALKSDHEPRHYSIEDLKNIRDENRRLLADLRKNGVKKI